MADVKTSALTALTAPADADLAMVVDVSDTTMAGSGTNKGIRFDEVREYTSGVVPQLLSGSGNAGTNTTAIQAALDAAETAGGGHVVIPVGLWYINATLNVGSRVTLAGLGWGSKLMLANTTSTTASPVPMIKAKDNTNYITIRDLYLDGNAANQTGDTTYVSKGIDFTRANTESTSAPTYDGGLMCSNVMVYNCKGTGFDASGTANTVRWLACYAYHNKLYGFYGKTDCMVVDCVSANNDADGFRWYAGTSILVLGCKGFGNGVRQVAADFTVSYSRTVLMSSCQAEDSCEFGFLITSSSHVTMEACQAYRMATRTGIADTNRAGFWVEDDGAGNLCHHIKIRGSADGTSGAAVMNYALTTRNLGAAVDIEIDTETITTGRWNHLSGARDCRAVFDANRLESFQSATYASSYTPDPYLGATINMALTGNITVNATAEPYVGQLLRFIFTQDSTGGRTVTWNSAYSVSWAPDTPPNKINVIDLQYNGTKWVQSSFPELVVTNRQTGTTYTLVLGDNGLIVEMNNASSNTLTVPPNSSVAFPIGTIIGVCQYGAGNTTVAAGAGVTIRSRGADLILAGQYSEVSLRKLGTDEWIISGDL